MISGTYESNSWNRMISSLPNAHLLQTWEWSQVKEKTGWHAMPFIWQDKPYEGVENLKTNRPTAAAMILERAIPVTGFAARLKIFYIPKGPLMDWGDINLRQRLLDDLQAFVKRQGAIFLKMDPDVILGEGIPNTNDAHEESVGRALKTELQRRGWQFSPDQIQFRNTVLVDLTPSEDELLARMKQKTRYNIRLAQRKGVTVRIGTMQDLSQLFRMYAETSIRDRFIIRDDKYYQTVWQTFMRSKAGMPSAEPLIAEVNRETVAAIFVYYFAGRAYYLYGMSRDAHREKMPNHLLQWEAIRRAKSKGCKTYDFWGAPNHFNEHDGMWGVFRFKEGFGGQVVRTLGAWDYVPNRFWYRMYTHILPRLLNILRARGKARTRQSIDV